MITTGKRITVQQLTILNRILDFPNYLNLVQLLDGSKNDQEISNTSQRDHSEPITEIPLDLALLKIAYDVTNYVSNQIGLVIGAYKRQSLLELNG